MDLFENYALARKPIDFTPVVDMHMHIELVNEVTPFATSTASNIEVMRQIGIQTAIISSLRSLSDFMNEGNQAIFNAIAEYPNHFLGFLGYDVAKGEERIEKLQSDIQHSNIVGLKIHSTLGKPQIDYDANIYHTLFNIVESHNMLILAHTFGWELEALERMIKQYTNTPFILAHAGAIYPEQYLKLAQKYDNVFLDFCFSGSPEGIIEYFVKGNIVDKLLWGSDCNFIAAEHQIGRVIFAKIKEEDKAKILGLNALKLMKNII